MPRHESRARASGKIPGGAQYVIGMPGAACARTAELSQQRDLAQCRGRRCCETAAVSKRPLCASAAMIADASARHLSLELPGAVIADVAAYWPPRPVPHQRAWV